jgi:hypothetical protein
MKKLLALAAVTAISATALAGAQFGIRGDVVGTNSYTDLANRTEPGSSYLEAQYARMLFTGKVSDNLKGDLWIDFLQTVSGVPSILKVAQIYQDFNPMFTAGIGRMKDAGIGGWEGLRPYYDMWIFSQDYQANFPMGLWLDININPDQQVKLVVLNQGWSAGSNGGSLTYSSTNQSLGNTTTNSTTTSQTNVGYGFRYKGAFGPFGVIGSYDIDPQQLGTGTNNNTLVAAGVKYEADALNVSLDYLGNTYTGIGTNAADNATKNSIVVMADYNLGMFKPRVKVESTTITDVPSTYYAQNNNTLTAANFWGSSVPSGAYTDGITRLDIGTDIRNNPGDALYYSVHYVTSSNTFSGNGISYANKTVSESAVYLSMIAMNDILK